MLQAVVVCTAVVPTLPVPLLKCLTFHPPPPLHLMTGCACVGGQGADIERAYVSACVCVVVHQGMNKSQRAWICFPWHDFRLNSRALDPDIRLSFSPKPQWAEKSTKHGNTNTWRHLPFLSHYLLLCGQVVPVALLVQVKDFSLTLFCSLYSVNEEERE